MFYLLILLNILGIIIWYISNTNNKSKHSSVKFHEITHTRVFDTESPPTEWLKSRNHFLKQ